MRVLLDVYTDEGQLHGQLHSAEHPEPIAFSGVVGLVAAIEQLDPGPEGPRTHNTQPTEEVTQ